MRKKHICIRCYRLWAVRSTAVPIPAGRCEMCPRENAVRVEALVDLRLK